MRITHSIMKNRETNTQAEYWPEGKAETEPHNWGCARKKNGSGNGVVHKQGGRVRLCGSADKTRGQKDAVEGSCSPKDTKRGEGAKYTHGMWWERGDPMG